VTDSGKRGRKLIRREDESSRFLRNVVKGTISYGVTSQKTVVFIVTAWITWKEPLGSVNFRIFSFQMSDCQFLKNFSDLCRRL